MKKITGHIPEPYDEDEEAEFPFPRLAEGDRWQDGTPEDVRLSVQGGGPRRALNHDGADDGDRDGDQSCPNAPTRRGPKTSGRRFRDRAVVHPGECLGEGLVDRDPRWRRQRRPG